MIENKNIIYFSCLNWNDNWQRQQEFAMYLAKRNKLLFISPIGFFNYTPKGLYKRIRATLRIRRGKQQEIHYKVPENIVRVNFLFIPWHNNAFFEFMNRKLLLFQLRRKLKKLNMEGSCIFWTGNPCRTVTQLSDYLNVEAFVYDNAMRFEELSEASPYVLEHEEEAVKKSTFTLTDNDFKKSQFESWGGVVYKVPQAVDLKVFDNTKHYEVPAAMRDIQHPIAGYYGGIHVVLDYDLLERQLQNLPDVNFVLLGAARDLSVLDRYKSYKNFFYLPPVPHSELPAYLAQFDVCLIPYVVNDYTKGTFPNKLFEYFSFGKPVVAEPLPEFEHYKEFMELTSDPDNFSKSIEKALLNGQSNKEKLSELVHHNDWNARFAAIEEAFLRAKI